ncbi:Protease HtpX [Fundidesulfovibrio magnetotacticus]|uniref:Protease HtpX homolog n=1 Tax=Fundidesulfovibrio magnetotacticus TaxID=2730080 RepID=A0A6V8LXW2_9BACT|nr:zinc metalloprotease HtpX [Fundidesulfovibrio magnetotacticus]GFK93115.1 Protease HtpX [Fundidesulfovibrio magnetotacticus]
MTSQLKTGLLLGLLTALLLLMGQAMGGKAGLVIALIMALVMNVGSYWFSDRIVLRMYNAQELSEADAPGLFDLVRQLAQRGNMPMPKLYLVPQAQPNAFATGRNPQNAAVAVTEGLLNLVSTDELAGVLAHELAHIKNRDILVQTVAAVVGGAVTSVASMLQWGAIFGMGRSDEEGGGGGFGAILMAILAPIAAMLIQMAISRSREYLADATGAQLAGNPLPLAGALKKLDDYAHAVPMQGANPATENMFIVSPLSGGGVAGLFSTHPPTEERIRRLRAMAGY